MYFFNITIVQSINQHLLHEITQGKKRLLINNCQNMIPIKQSVIYKHYSHTIFPSFVYKFTRLAGLIVRVGF